jgi:hypothetical protein
MKTYRGDVPGSGNTVPPFTTSVLDGDGWSDLRPCCLTPRKQPTVPIGQKTECCEQETVSYFTGNQAPVARQSNRPLHCVIPGLVSAYACSSRLDFWLSQLCKGASQPSGCDGTIKYDSVSHGKQPQADWYCVVVCVMYVRTSPYTLCSYHCLNGAMLFIHCIFVNIVFTGNSKRLTTFYETA